MPCTEHSITPRYKSDKIADMVALHITSGSCRQTQDKQARQRCQSFAKSQRIADGIDRLSGPEVSGCAHLDRDKTLLWGIDQQNSYVMLCICAY